MHPTDLFLKYNGKYLDFDGVNGNQCVDVIKAYFKEVLNLLPRQGNAIDYWTDIPGFTRIKKGFFNQPNPGDIIIWGTDIGPYGHIAICNWSRLFDFGGFEQNFPLGSPCHYQDHTGYRGVLGWLRPNNPPAEDSRPIPVSSQQPQTLKVLYLSDTDDIKDAITYCDAKFKEFTNGLLGVTYSFKKTVPITSPDGYDLDQKIASDLVEDAMEPGFHGAILGHYGNSPSAGFSTFTSFHDNIIMTNAFKPVPQDNLLFELKHQAILWYNTHRGTNPFIENIDNYTGGLDIVKKQLAQLIPYSSVFKI